MPGPKNYPKDKIHLNSFIGGHSVDYKYGIANSFYFSTAMDFRQKASQMSVLPGMSTISSTLKDLPLVMLQDPTGIRWMVGDGGYLYKVNASDIISNEAKLTSNGSAGMVYNQQSDLLYMAGQQTVSTFGQLQAAVPKLTADLFAQSASTANGTVNMYDAATGAYDIPRNDAASVPGAITTPNQVNDLTENHTEVNYTVIQESPQFFCPFIPDIEPFYSIAVFVKKVGTGNLTLTLHDSLNNQLAAVTISNASLKTGWNEFVFGAPGVRAIPNAFATGAAAGYHFHLTSSVNGDTTRVGTIDNSNLTGTDFLLFAYRLVKTTNTWHPMAMFGQYMCIGNGPYLSTYNFANDASPNNQQWVRHQLSLDFGYEVCGLTVNNQYLVIAAEKRSSNGNRNFQDGMLYFWDGQNVNFNFKIEIPMGAPYSPYTLNNITYFTCAGSLFAWGGGQQVIKVRYLAYQNTDFTGSPDTTVVNPNMMDVRYNLLMIGYPSSTTNVNVNYGVYSWGAVELTYPNSFGYSYTLANGVQNYSGSNNLQIGMIKNFVDQMYMSWKYTSGGVTQYGIDIVTSSSSPASTFSWQSLIYDGGVRYKTKLALRVRFNFLSWPANCTLTPMYNIDRKGWVSVDPTGGTRYGSDITTNDTAVTLELNEARFKEIQIGFTGTCAAGTTAPTFTGATIEIDPLEDEVAIRNDTKG